jgi:hypothetical protein
LTSEVEVLETVVEVLVMPNQYDERSATPQDVGEF